MGGVDEMVDWPGEEEVSEIVNALKRVEPGFDVNVRSWGQFKSKFPILREWFATHARHHEYLSEVSICNSEECEVFQKLGRKVRTPGAKDGCLREAIIRRVDRPIADPRFVGHFV